MLVVLDALMQFIGPYRVPGDELDEMEGAMIAFFGSPVLVQTHLVLFLCQSQKLLRILNRGEG